MYNWILLLVAAIVGVLSGFANNSRGALFTERVKTLLSVAFICLLGSIIIIAIIEKIWIYFLFVVFLLILAPGVGLVVFNTIAGQAQNIPVGHWILTIVFIVGCYFMVKVANRLALL